MSFFYALFADSSNESAEFLGFEREEDIYQLFEESDTEEEFFGFWALIKFNLLHTTIRPTRHEGSNYYY